MEKIPEKSYSYGINLEKTKNIRSVDGPPAPRFKNIAGHKFGKLIALRPTEKRIRSSIVWECSCSCGNTILTTSNRLNTGTINSCGCARILTGKVDSKIHGKCRDLTGQRFGKLTVLSPTSLRSGKTVIWLCKCDCGNKHKVSVSCLTTGRSTSCGCLDHRNNSKNGRWTGFNEITGSYFSSLLRGAITRNLDFSIAIEEVWNLFIKQNRKCALSGLSINFAPQKVREQTASLDRIDSSKGYVTGNVQWLHKDINAMKWSKSQQEFIQLCKSVAYFNL